MDKAENQGKMVYLFEEGRANMRSLLGGKGAGLAEMTRIGLPVPPGMTITTEVCRQYYKVGNHFPEGLADQIKACLKVTEQKAGKKFGDATNPLLISVRSGAIFSMPGMMDTILNLGLNDVTVEGMAAATANRRFAFDAYRRFIQMFGDVVLEIHKHAFEELLTKRKEMQGVKFDQELTAESLAALVSDYKKLVTDQSGRPFPQDPMEQLFMSVEAVFRSWNNERAIVYRNLNRISHDLGTAVNIQSMVFGNMGDDCGTGVAFTRNPSTGEKLLYGEFLTNAQGEDVVAGIRTPRPISELKDQMPEMYKQFVQAADTLEHHYKDMQDIEFTIERGRLYMLQTRNGKRTGRAAVQVAYDLVQENILTPAEAIMKVEPAHIEQLMHRQIDPKAKLDVIAKGLPASPGAASGAVVFDANTAAKKATEGIKTLLVRMETTPEDIHGMVAAQGILTSRGGMTSHAAVVARGMGKPCVCGCDALRIDYETQTATVAGHVIKAGDILSLDGSTGRVILGAVPVVDAMFSKEYDQVLKWADSLSRMKVRANADTPEDAKLARSFGAQGIGLTRTEHMFMGADRLPYVQRMILADSQEERVEPLSHLQKMQESDFYGILKAMHGLPVTVRLLDPPLHEFLPNYESVLVETVELRITGKDPERLAEQEVLLSKIRELHEFNPMLGHRGCRLGITHPDVYDMQVRAIFNACVKLTKEGVHVLPEVEIPLTIDFKEMDFFKTRIDAMAKEIMIKEKVHFEYSVGSMIEMPRAALLAGELAEISDFFSFGTNDLTQTTFGFSRDDAEGKFMDAYLEGRILKDDPFIILDRRGVGQLMRMTVEAGRTAKPNLLIGICGEHGGEPNSVEFCHQIGLDFVSCSPFRVPVARLAAAQANVVGAEGATGTK
ncbi:MAG TPA: pyruvate, phosphate dikinase [Negativicutes bacterium]|nr:pyruvate, phosphate dikinase [Negativicutes bacterium]